MVFLVISLQGKFWGYPKIKGGYPGYPKKMVGFLLMFGKFFKTYVFFFFWGGGEIYGKKKTDPFLDLSWINDNCKE